MRANPNESLPQHSPTFVRPGSQVTVTIGRNVPDRATIATPMSDMRWAAFQSEVRDVLADILLPTMTFGPFTGTGEWDGVSEESSVLIVISHYPASVRTITDRLAVIAARYGQDAIAWSFGPNLLATP